MQVKRTISFSDQTLDTLDNLVPKSKRSKFIDSVVIDALKQVAKEKALDALECFEKMDSSSQSVVETLQNIRQSESDRLSKNH